MPPTRLAKSHPPPLVLDDTSTDSTGRTDPMEDWQDAQGSPALFPSQSTPVVPMRPAEPHNTTLLEVPETPPYVLQAARRKRTLSEAAAGCGAEKLELMAVTAHNAVVAAVVEYEKIEKQFREHLETDAKAKLAAAAEEIRGQRDAGFRKKLARLAELEQTRQRSLKEEYEETVRRLTEKYEADSARANKSHEEAIRQLQDEEEKTFISQYKTLEAEFEAGVEAGMKRIGKRAKAARVQNV